MVLVIKFPLVLSELQRLADRICDLSTGIALEEIIEDSVAVYVGGYDIEEWLEHVEVNVLQEHVPSGFYNETKEFCGSIMRFLIVKYQEFNLPRFSLNYVTDIELDFKKDHTEITIEYKER